MEYKSLKRKTMLAYGWSVAKSGIDQFSSFIVFLVLGRMLTPDDFGVVAIAAAVVEVLRLISWVGLYEAIIRAPELDEIAADTAFWTSVTGGVLLAGGLIFAAGPIAALFGNAALRDVIAVMSIIVVASALGITHTGRVARGFGHKALAMRALAANLVGGVAAIAFVLAGFGLWALVAQRLAAEIVQTVSVWIAFPWVPRFRFSSLELKRLVAFGASMTVVNIVNGINMRVQEGVAGMYLPTAAVGAFRIANRLTELIQQLVFMPAYQAALVAFSRLQGDPKNLLQAYLQAIRLAGLVAFPCFFGLAAVAPALVPWLFGKQWAGSVPILQALCVSVVPYTVQYFSTPLLIAAGRPGGLAGFSVVNLAAGVALTVLAAPFGVVWVAAGLSLRAWLMTPMALILLKTGSGIAPPAVLAALAPPFAAALATAVPTFYLGNLLADSVPVPALLAIQTATYATFYVGFVVATARRFVTETLASLLP